MIKAAATSEKRNEIMPKIAEYGNEMQTLRQYIEAHEMTMAFQDELHPKITMTEGKTMGNTRTIAFQVPEDLFRKIKDYLQRNHMTQKDFILGLIEDTELDESESQGMKMGM